MEMDVLILYRVRRELSETFLMQDLSDLAYKWVVFFFALVVLTMVEFLKKRSGIIDNGRSAACCNGVIVMIYDGDASQ